MPRLLFLAHRLPYPPDKGDRIRSWHILEHLLGQFDVELGCLSDDVADLDHVPSLRAICAAVECVPVQTGMAAAARALSRARPGLPLTLGWFHSARLQAWVAEGLAAGRYDAAFVYSSAMAPYVIAAPGWRDVRSSVLDLVDVDSEKWLAYAADAPLPQRWVWAREARTLLAYERRAAACFGRTILVSEAERDRFAQLAPEVAARTDWVDNGVDLARFDPAEVFANPFSGRAPALVFTGTMDYRPNIQAVQWFTREVMPLLRVADWQGGAAPEFHIVGARPSEAVRALASAADIHVTGRVADTRPYLAHAAVAVAPLLIARGIQNKVLEAMAMARPVIASAAAFEGVRATPGRDLLVAGNAHATARAIGEVLRGEHPQLGRAGRLAMERGHDWAVTLRRLSPMLEASM